MLQVDVLHHSILGRRARAQSDDHHVQANLPAAKTTIHTMRNRNIETAKLACFLNSLRPSLIRVVRRKNIERTKRKIGIAAAMKAMILKIIVHSQCRVTRSFDHLVGACEQCLRCGQPQRLSSLEVDSQFEFRWLLNGKINRLVSVENTGSINANLAICVSKAGTVAYKAACCCELAPLVNCGYRVPRRQRNELIAPPCKKRRTGNQEHCRCAGKGGNQVRFATGLRDNNSLPDGVSRLLHFA